MRRFARGSPAHLRGQRRGVYLRDGTPFGSGQRRPVHRLFLRTQQYVQCRCGRRARAVAKYPERKIYAVDSLCASLGQGLLVYLAAQERAKGKGIEEVRDWLETEKFHLCHWFTVEDLQFLKRGGRVSAATRPGRYDAEHQAGHAYG